jgi:hypothetical protein
MEQARSWKEFTEDDIVESIEADETFFPAISMPLEANVPTDVPSSVSAEQTVPHPVVLSRRDSFSRSRLQDEGDLFSDKENEMEDQRDIADCHNSLIDVSMQT